MTENELKHLNRRELLEMLIIKKKKIDRLQAELDEANEKLEQRKLDIKNSGSIAEASIRINNVFASAQTAAEQYLENVHNLHAATEEECRKLREETEAECQKMKLHAKEQADKYIQETKQIYEQNADEFIAQLQKLIETSFDRESIKKRLFGDIDEEEKEGSSTECNN